MNNISPNKKAYVELDVTIPTIRWKNRGLERQTTRIFSQQLQWPCVPLTGSIRR